ncbi:hypothetical protein KYC5002_00425 [Archangium violaceum]|uniref:hypothetical protein n=1 Tax=Archangium violaceum TaxID=83451 RepID=UPI002B301A8F|nr:hypothetical protein KYC5002_00425 [Archangium gephyra]
MGNSSGKAKPKPLLVTEGPGEGTGAYKLTITEKSDHEDASFAASSAADAYYLPWKSGDVTECEINLATRKIQYFFTANLSGCSLWYKFDGAKIKIRHEARTDSESQRLHRLAGFTCVVDSSLNKDDIQLVIDDKTMIRHAQFYCVYALIDYEERQIEFRAQLVKNQKNLLSKVESYELVKTTTIEVPIPR